MAHPGAVAVSDRAPQATQVLPALMRAKDTHRSPPWLRRRRRVEGG
jgi:hypothetical protein